MRLEPVYLLGGPTPPSKDSSRVTRRRLLWTALAAGVGGFVAGAGVSRIGDAERAVRKEADRTTEDPLVQWALALQEGEGSALLESSEAFTMVHARFDDPRLDRGLIRLAAIIGESEHIEAGRRHRLARMILERAATASNAAMLSPLVESLRTIR